MMLSPLFVEDYLEVQLELELRCSWRALIESTGLSADAFFISGVISGWSIRISRSSRRICRCGKRCGHSGKICKVSDVVDRHSGLQTETIAKAGQTDRIAEVRVQSLKHAIAERVRRCVS